MIRVILCLLFWTSNLSKCEDTYWHIRYIQKILDVGVKISTNQTWFDAWEENAQKANEARPLDVEFTCGSHISRPPSTSVHTLHPADIAVVGALGDFVSAGRGMNVKSIFEIFNKENRGEAFSAGGEGSLTTGVLTVPNILRQFNPSLKGYGLGHGDHNSRTAGFNVANAYGTASTLLEQAEHLVTKMKSDTRIEYEKDWKLVTIMIGHHDLCRYCLDEEHYSDAEFIRHVTDTIDYLQRHMPRSLVSLVPAFDYSTIQTIGENTLSDTLQSLSCPCVADADTREGMKLLHMMYYNRLQQLAFSGTYDNTHNFTVVFQPHLVNMDFPGSSIGIDMEPALFGPDCFHLGRQGQQALALMLWNTMMTPVGNKPMSYPLEESLELKCPTWTRPYIFTNVNSGWIQLPPGEQEPTEPQVGEAASPDQLEKVFLMILVGFAGALVAFVILGIFIPLLQKKRKPAPKDPQEQQESILMKNPRLRELMQEEGATRNSSKVSLRSVPSGASLVRSGSALSFDNSAPISPMRSYSQTSDDNSDAETSSIKFYFQSDGNMEHPLKYEQKQKRSYSPITPH